MKSIAVILFISITSIATATTFNIIDSGVEISGSIDLWDPDGNHIKSDSYSCAHPTSIEDIVSFFEHDPSISVDARSYGEISISNNYINCNRSQK